MLIARSSPECHLYMELHPCACGETRGPEQHQLEQHGDDLVAVYAGPCVRCGAPRRFELVLDPELPPADTFGGSSPSKIIDAGQYLAVADAAASHVPGDAAGLSPDERRRARRSLQRAINALEEVLKFIPAGADRVDASTLFTDEGRAIHAREPGRFRKVRLDAVLAVYRELIDKLR